MVEERRTGGVQSIARAFQLLEAVAANNGVMGVSQMSQVCDLPLPTIHRLVRTLVDLGYLRQEPSRRYALGPRLLVFAESTATMLNAVAVPHLRHLVDELGESANLAMLDGDQIVYIAQVPGSHSMRMFTEVGRRVHPHCTAVGKALLARHDDTDVRAVLARTGMPRHTDHTIVDADSFIAQLKSARSRGYAVDEGEQEVGVRCVGTAVPHDGVQLAMSVSGPAARMTDELIERCVPVLLDAGSAFSKDLAS